MTLYILDDLHLLGIALGDDAAHGRSALAALTKHHVHLTVTTAAVVGVDAGRSCLKLAILTALGTTCNTLALRNTRNVAAEQLFGATAGLLALGCLALCRLLAPRRAPAGTLGTRPRTGLATSHFMDKK